MNNSVEFLKKETVPINVWFIVLLSILITTTIYAQPNWQTEGQSVIGKGSWQMEDAHQSFNSENIQFIAYSDSGKVMLKYLKIGSVWTPFLSQPPSLNDPLFLTNEIIIDEKDNIYLFVETESAPSIILGWWCKYSSLTNTWSRWKLTGSLRPNGYLLITNLFQEPEFVYTKKTIHGLIPICPINPGVVSYIYLDGNSWNVIDKSVFSGNNIPWYGIGSNGNNAPLAVRIAVDSVAYGNKIVTADEIPDLNLVYNENSEIQLFPNPAETTIQFTKAINGIVYNLMGGKMITMDQSSSFSVEHFPEGMYIIYCDGGEVLKFVKK